MWPTPIARDWKDSGPKITESKRETLPQKIAKSDKDHWINKGSSLNPTWVEGLMGYPHGWTDLGNEE